MTKKSQCFSIRALQRWIWSVPYHFFAGMMGARVHLITNQPDLNPVKSDMGLAVEPTVTLADCPRDLTIVFAPGGTDGTIAAARDPATIDFIRNRGSRAQYITSVCTGALILGAAGLLRESALRHTGPYILCFANLVRSLSMCASSLMVG